MAVENPRLGRGGVAAAPVSAAEPTSATVGCYRSDNSLVEGSRVEVEVVPGGVRGRRQVRMPEGYALPAEGVYLRVDVEGETPFIIPVPTSPEERAAFGLGGEG